MRRASPCLCAAAVLFLLPLQSLADPPTAGSLLNEQSREPVVVPPGEPAPVLTQPEKAAPAAQTGEPSGFVLSAVAFVGNTAIDAAQLDAVVQPWIGKQIAFADLVQVAEAVTAYYRNGGYLLARAMLPPQEIVNGAVRIEILEGHYGTASIDNRSRVDSGLAERALSAVTATGAVVQRDNLESTLLLLNELPGARASATFTPGAAVGEANLVTILAATPRVSGEVVVDNHGDYFTGRNRVRTSVLANNLAGNADQLVASATTTGDGLVFGSLDYALPVWALRHRFGVGISRLDYELGKSLEPLGNNGDTIEYQGYWRWQAVRSRQVNVASALHLLHRDLEDRTAAFAVTSPKTVSGVRASLNADNRDARRRWAWMAEAIGTVGELNRDSAVDSAMDDLTTRAEGAFTKANLRGGLQFSPGDSTLAISLEVQFAGGNLDSSEKFTLAGANAVRGYPVGEQSGDEGVLARIDWQLPLSRIGGDALRGWTGRIFADHGEVRINKETWVGYAGDNSRDLADAGVGLDWARGDWRLALAYAHHLGDESATVYGDDPDQLWALLAWQF